MTEIKRECAGCGEVMNEEDMLTIGDNFYCNDCSFICEKCECAEYANDVRWTLRRMFEVYFMCDAMSGMEITTCDCNDQCAKYGCSNCTAADDAELLQKKEKSRKVKLK